MGNDVSGVSWEPSALKAEGQLYLERAEAVLFQRLCEDVRDGNFDNADRAVYIMQELSII